MGWSFSWPKSFVSLLNAEKFVVHVNVVAGDNRFADEKALSRKQYELIPHGFSLWYLSFNLGSVPTNADTTGFMPVEVQFQPNPVVEQFVVTLKGRN